MRVLLATDRPSLGAALVALSSQSAASTSSASSRRPQDVERRGPSKSHADVVLVDWHLGEVATTETVRRSQARPRDHARHRPEVQRRLRGRATCPGAAAFATMGDAPDALLALLREVVPSGS